MILRQSLNSLILVVLLVGVAFGQKSVPRHEYYVEGFTGGLNVVTDSIDVARNEMILAQNFTMDRFGALHKRFGIEAWNDSLISANTILDIHYVEDKNGDKNLYIATNNYVYQLPGWTDTVNTWAGKEIDYTTGRLITDTTDATGHVKGVFGQADSMSWILVADPGDLMVIGDSTYTIDSVYADTMLLMTTAVDLHDTTTYRLIKTVKGIPQLSSWNGKLYVADDRGDSWWYDGDSLKLLGILDYGNLDTVIVTDSSLIPYTEGQIQLYAGPGSNVFFPLTVPYESLLVRVGEQFHIGITRFVGRFSQYYEFSSELLQATGNNIVIYDAITEINFEPDLPLGILYPMQIMPDTSIDPFNRYILNWWVAPLEGPYGSANKSAIRDTTKNWVLNKWQGFWVINGNNAKKRGYIGRNEDDLIYFDSTVAFTSGDKYYIAWQIPAMAFQRIITGYNPGGSPIFEDSLVTNRRLFSQIFFHRNRLYAIGKEINGIGFEGSDQEDTISTNRIWFSDIGIPEYIPSDWNFDITGTGSLSSFFSQDATRLMFKLRNDLYILTGNNIYRMSGEPNPSIDGFDIFLSQSIAGIGTNQPNGVITTKDNIAYIMNQQGIWVFDGNEINKISYFVDPLVEQYRGSRMTAGKFKDNIFFSYPDSNKTLLYFDPLKKFYGPWDVGMLTINDQSVAIDSNYFLFSRVEDSAYVLKYPRDNSNYTDILAPSDTSVIFAHYKSGWQVKAMGTLRDKVVQDFEITAYNPVCVNEAENYISINTNFGGSGWDSTAFACGNRIHLFNNIGIRAKSFQVEVKDSTEFDFSLSNYLIRWYKGDGGGSGR